MHSTIIALALILAASPLTAQARWPLSLELNGGHGLGRTSGEYRGDGSGIAIDALVAYRITAGSGAGMVAAFSTGAQGASTTDLLCVPAEGGGCVPNFPSFSSAALLVGYETGVNWTVRGLIGPAYARAEESTLGLQGRAELAVPLISRISVAFSSRALLLPDYRGTSFQLYAFGLGLRVR
jgi:hypothetical protein